MYSTSDRVKSAWNDRGRNSKGDSQSKSTQGDNGKNMNQSEITALIDLTMWKTMIGQIYQIMYWKCEESWRKKRSSWCLQSQSSRHKKNWKRWERWVKEKGGYGGNKEGGLGGRVAEGGRGEDRGGWGRRGGGGRGLIRTGKVAR